MKDPENDIRTWLHQKLSGITYGGSSVPVYTFPPKDAAMPYIVIGDASSPGESSTKDGFLIEYNVTLEIWVSFTGNDASMKPVNAISNSIMQAIRTLGGINSYSYIGTEGEFADWNAIRCEIREVITDRFLSDRGPVIYKSININFYMEEL